MYVSSHAQEAVLGEIHGRLGEEGAGRQRQLRDFGASIAFEIESRRPSRRMVAAVILGLDDQRPALAGNLGAEARAGDSAADDNDIEIGHSCEAVTNWKAAPSSGGVMFNGTFTALLLLALAATLIVAAVVDVRTFTISNRLNLAVALGAPLYWLSIPLASWPAIGIQLAAAAIVFVLLAAAFFAGMMGGGDVKLAAALALWFPPLVTIKFLVLMSLAGGVLTLVVLGWHRANKREGRPEIPYGVAIAFGALAVLGPILTQRFLNQFA